MSNNIENKNEILANAAGDENRIDATAQANPGNDTPPGDERETAGPTQAKTAALKQAMGLGIQQPPSFTSAGRDDELKDKKTLKNTTEVGVGFSPVGFASRRKIAPDAGPDVDNIKGWSINASNTTYIQRYKSTMANTQSGNKRIETTSYDLKPWQNGFEVSGSLNSWKITEEALPGTLDEMHGAAELNRKTIGLKYTGKYSKNDLVFGGKAGAEFMQESNKTTYWGTEISNKHTIAGSVAGGVFVEHPVNKFTLKHEIGGSYSPDFLTRTASPAGSDNQLGDRLTHSTGHNYWTANLSSTVYSPDLLTSKKQDLRVFAGATLTLNQRPAYYKSETSINPGTGQGTNTGAVVDPTISRDIVGDLSLEAGIAYTIGKEAPEDAIKEFDLVYPEELEKPKEIETEHKLPKDLLKTIKLIGTPETPQRNPEPIRDITPINNGFDLSNTPDPYSLFNKECKVLDEVKIRDANGRYVETIILKTEGLADKLDWNSSEGATAIMEPLKNGYYTIKDIKTGTVLEKVKSTLEHETQLPTTPSSTPHDGSNGIEAPNR